jgi:hypothetical protein
MVSVIEKPRKKSRVIGHNSGEAHNIAQPLQQQKKVVYSWYVTFFFP